MEKELQILNYKILEAEKEHDKTFLQSILTDDLTFRRATGIVVNRDGYLKSLDSRIYDYILNEDIEIESNADEAFVTLIVKAKIQMLDTHKRPDKVIVGKWINRRFFRKVEGIWKMHAWYNQDANNDLKKEQQFSGSVWANELAAKSGQKNTKCRSVFFEMGARTFWHAHNGPQELIVIAGEAEVVLKYGEKEEKTILKVGEKILIPTGVLHWHGAAVNNHLVHIAINHPSISGNESTTLWFEEVQK